MGAKERAEVAFTACALPFKTLIRQSGAPPWCLFASPSGELHEGVQGVMGWDDSHLHGFTKGREEYGVPSPDDWRKIKDERRVKEMLEWVGEDFDPEKFDPEEADSRLRFIRLRAR